MTNSKKNSDLLLRYDFQGWPIYKINWKEILEVIGTKINDNTYTFTDEVLNTYPIIFEDDGMGYSPIVKNICDIESADRIWIDLKTENNE